MSHSTQMYIVHTIITEDVNINLRETSQFSHVMTISMRYTGTWKYISIVT